MKHPKTIQQLCMEFENVCQQFTEYSDISISDIDAVHTLHIIVDMINGFVKEGALSSNEVLSVNQPVADFTKECRISGIETVALADNHTQESTEFSTYPVHCLKGTAECELTDEISFADDSIRIFGKNSTNGFLEPEFADYIRCSEKNTFIITGDCTDMCVLQLALSMKADFDRRNIPCRIIVPYSLTATCSLPGHDPELAEIMALFLMKTNGIEVVKNIK